MNILKLILIFSLVITSSYALKKNEVADLDYRIHVGLDDKAVVGGTTDKTEANRVLPKTIKKQTAVKSVDYTDSYILYQINEQAKLDNKQFKSSDELISIPSTLNKQINGYYEKIKTLSEAQKVASNKNEVQHKFLILNCRTFKDYKINQKTNIKMICRDKKDRSEIYKLSALVDISTTGNNLQMEANAYMLEDSYGKNFNINKDDSKIYNAVSGNNNLATYVDKRAAESIIKAMGTTIGTDAPTLSKDYIEKKNAAQSTVVVNGDTSTVGTTTPEPIMHDYGVSLLVNTIGSGIKAGFEQLYRDLGYIYYIPKDSLIDAEIVIEIN